MKKIPFRFIVFTLILVSAFSFGHPVSAHGREPRLEISVERLNPGGTVDLRGVDFEPEEPITLSLAGPSVAMALSEVTADVEGIFLQTIELPADLPEGIYTFYAVTDDHEIFSPSLTVSGTPILDEETGGQREEEEPLLAPVPTHSTSLSAGSLPAPAQSADSQAEALSKPSANLPWLGIIAAAVIALGLAVLVGRGLRKR